jgi:hypothetical protein
MNETCGCCEGIEKLTPRAIANRPGLNTLVYRAGTHASFLETMKARLSNYYLDIPLDEFDDLGQPKTKRIYPVRGLTARTADDPAIALLDAWATVGDVLTFYQQRLANEGYLRTATERRSILELARLVGYRLRPGVAASTYLAYTLENGNDVTIPEGSRAQSLPGPNELPQSFETSQELEARAVWNKLMPRLNQPQTKTGIINQDDGPRVYLKGISANLKPNDPLLIDFGDSQGPKLFRVKAVTTDALAGRTKVTLQPVPTKQMAAAAMAAAAMAAPTAAGQPSTKMRASVIGDFVASFSEAASLEPAQLIDLIRRFADDLLVTFTALASMPASPARDQAIGDTRSVLNEILAALDRVLKVIGDNKVLFYFVTAVKDWIKRALAILEAAKAPPEPPPPPTLDGRIGDLLTHLLEPAPLAAIPPRSPQNLAQSLGDNFAPGSDAVFQIVTKMQPALESVFYAAYRNLAYRAVSETMTDTRNAIMLEAAPPEIKVYALRVTAPLFGHNAPKHASYSGLPPHTTWQEWTPQDAGDEAVNTVFLDNAYDKVMPEDYLVIQKVGETAQVLNINQVVTRPRTAYDISSKTTQITLAPSKTWWDPAADDFTIIRNTVVYTQSEELPLALEPITETIPELTEPPSKNKIELGDLYHGLKAGQWLIVTGERTDIADVTGVTGTELVMLGGTHQIGAAGRDDNTHSLLILANDLRYTYRRDTVTIYGNVVPATHGETRKEVLGSGDGSQPLQQLALRQSPLTYLAAPTPAGADSTLKVYVNDVQWHEAESLTGLRPADRQFISRTDDNDKTTAIFGNGKQGARLPTGVENVRAVYRTGIGKPGNVQAGQISLLITRPLGVKSVVNPLAATGGADRESRDQARRNAPLAVMSLDRLVSVQDYADFARTFAGIGKATAAHLSDRRRQLVHVTIAGADDIPIDETSELYRNLLKAFRRSGDPYQPLQVDVRELLWLVVSANVSINPDYLWEKVEPQIRAALLDTFSFERRELGQPAFLSEVIATIQSVAGVTYVDVDTFGCIPEKQTDETDKKAGIWKRHVLTPVQITDCIRQLLNRSAQHGPDLYVEAGLAQLDHGAIQPAQIAYFSPAAPATLVLKGI